MMDPCEQVPVPASEIVSSTVDGEAVLVLPVRGQVKVLNEAGAFIWGLVDGQRTVRQIAAGLCTVYEVAADVAETDTLRFLNDLAGRGVITWS